MRTAVARLAEVVVFAGLLLGVWLITLSAVSSEELWVAVPASFLAAAAGVWAGIAMEQSWQIRARFLKPLAILPIAVVSDAAQVLWGGVRPASSPPSFERIRVEGGQGSSPLARGRRALAIFFVSATPGTVVLDLDPSNGEALVHSLGGRGPKMTDVVAT